MRKYLKKIISAFSVFIIQKFVLFNSNINIAYIIFIISFTLFWIINLLLPITITAFCTLIDVFSNASISSALMPLGVDENMEHQWFNVNFMTGSDRNPVMDINFIINSDPVKDNVNSSHVDNDNLNPETTLPSELTEAEKDQLLTKVNNEESRGRGNRRTFEQILTEREMRWVQEKVIEDKGGNSLSDNPFRAAMIQNRLVAAPYTGQVRKYIYGRNV